MIRSYPELKFYIQADRIMNGFPSRISILVWASMLLTNSWRGKKIRYLRALRYYSYYKHSSGIKCKFLQFFYGRQFRKLVLILGYSIGEDVFGYGLVLPHYGTIVVGGSNRCGNYAVLHTSTCIADCNSVIGDNFDFATGSIISKQVKIGDSVATCANSCIISDIPHNSLVAGSPATVVRSNYHSWYERDGVLFQQRIKKVEQLKKSLNNV